MVLISTSLRIDGLYGDLGTLEPGQKVSCGGRGAFGVHRETDGRQGPLSLVSSRPWF